MTVTSSKSPASVEPSGSPTASSIASLVASQVPILPLTARGLSLHRGRQAILRNLDFGVAVGEIVLLRGVNGAGKTTLLECLAGLLRPTAGTIRWFGQSGQPAAWQRRFIGFLGHEGGVYPALSARANLVLAGRLTGVAQPGQRARELLEFTGLIGQADWPVERFSRGMKQRLALARSLIHDPPLVLLDEPFTCLDAEGRRWLERYLQSLRDHHRTIVLTSHHDGERQPWVDRTLWLERGGLHPPCQAESK